MQAAAVFASSPLFAFGLSCSSCWASHISDDSRPGAIWLSGSKLKKLLPSKEALATFGPIFPLTATLVASSLTIYLGLHGSTAPPYMNAILWLIGATVLSLCFALMLSIRAARAIRRANDLAQTNANLLLVLKHLEAILALDYQYCAYIQQQVEYDAASVRAEFYDYIDGLLEKTVEICDLITGSKCAACIKAFSKTPGTQNHIDPHADAPPEGNADVFTVRRDPRSRVQRRHSDAKGSATWSYPYKGNTAFSHIMHIEELKGYFYKNNLTSLSADEYKNLNPRWREHYNNIAVAALRNPDHPEIDKAIGFICVDSMDGSFDDSFCREIIECVASIAYYSISMTWSTAWRNTQTNSI